MADSERRKGENLPHPKNGEKWLFHWNIGPMNKTKARQFLKPNWCVGSTPEWNRTILKSTQGKASNFKSIHYVHYTKVKNQTSFDFLILKNHFKKNIWLENPTLKYNIGKRFNEIITSESESESEQLIFSSSTGTSIGLLLRLGNLFSDFFSKSASANIFFKSTLVSLSRGVCDWKLWKKFWNS